jgi:hypothetical protein
LIHSLSNAVSPERAREFSGPEVNSIAPTTPRVLREVYNPIFSSTSRSETGNRKQETGNRDSTAIPGGRKKRERAKGGRWEMGGP